MTVAGRGASDIAKVIGSYLNPRCATNGSYVKRYLVHRIGDCIDRLANATKGSTLGIIRSV